MAPLTLSRVFIVSSASSVKSTAFTILIVSTASSTLLITFTVAPTAFVASPTPVTNGIRSITSPASPAHAHGSAGAAITSATLKHSDTTSNSVSHKSPSVSMRLAGLFPQYAYALCPRTPWPVESRTSEEINLPTSGL